MRLGKKKHKENGEKYVCHGFQFAPRAAFGDCQLNATINQIYLFAPLVSECVCVCVSLVGAIVVVRGRLISSKSTRRVQKMF